MADRARVRRVAAGGILWRRVGSGIEIAVIRHPRTQRWSLPKGRPQPRESLRAAAVREVTEETGLRFSCEEPLGSVVTTEPDGTLKVAAYWWMAVKGGMFVPNPEADRLHWVAPAMARRFLRSPRDLAALELVSAEAHLRRSA